MMKWVMIKNLPIIACVSCKNVTQDFFGWNILLIILDYDVIMIHRAEIIHLIATADILYYIEKKFKTKKGMEFQIHVLSKNP